MNILVFGDSITQGFDDTEKGGWVNRLFLDVGTRSKGQAHDNFHAVFNLGISGATTDEIVKRIDNELDSRSEGGDLIIFDTGGNDSVRNLVKDECQTPLDRFVKNYASLIKSAKRYGQVVCLGIHDSDESRLNPIPWYKDHASLDADAQKHDAEIKRLAEEHGALYIEMRGVLSKDFDALTYDGDHPNAEGHRLIFERVKEALEKEEIL